MFFSAAARSESSGMLLHRKNDRRDASSGSVMRYGVLGAALSGWPSNLNRKFGLTRMLRSASSSPESNASGPPFFNASLYRAIGIRRSASITGRRYARRASAAMIFLAQASSAGDAGWLSKCRVVKNCSRLMSQETESIRNAFNCTGTVDARDVVAHPQHPADAGQPRDRDAEINAVEEIRLKHVDAMAAQCSPAAPAPTTMASKLSPSTRTEMRAA